MKPTSAAIVSLFATAALALELTITCTDTPCDELISQAIQTLLSEVLSTTPPSTFTTSTSTPASASLTPPPVPPSPPPLPLPTPTPSQDNDTPITTTTTGSLTPVTSIGIGISITLAAVALAAATWLGLKHRKKQKMNSALLAAAGQPPGIKASSELDAKSDVVSHYYRAELEATVGIGGYDDRPPAELDGQQPLYR
ncbi:hypothetical protein QBC39DRAFT_346872 [Podospora conica]|nr:hypothetical protein QBC39DRAFT_346872 [Schizothecium conicum]